MNAEEIAAIRERAEAATEGPWIAEFSGEQGNCVLPHDAQSTREAVAITRLYHQVFDAEFIAHAREDVPLLLAEVERLNARLDKVRSLADSMDREAPKPQPGGFIADAIRQALDGCDQ